MIKLHVLNSGGQLDQYEDRILKIANKASIVISKLLPVERVDITFQYNPSVVIPEVGVGGFAPTANLIQISLDPNNQNFNLSIDEELTATMAHELHHCMRWRGVGYGSTLKEVLITEGLARSFELNFRSDHSLPIYHQVFSDTEIKELLLIAQKEFSNPTFNYTEWFFTGSNSKGIPIRAGYTLGYEIVKQYINKTGRPAEELWNEPASLFF